MGSPTAHAAVGRGGDKQVESGEANEGGGTSQSSAFRLQDSFGQAIATGSLSSSRFRMVPGALGGSSSIIPPPPVNELKVQALYAKTAPLGIVIAPATWQRDNDPIFIWEPPLTGPEVAGYSYAIDAVPDSAIDTTATSLDIAASALNTLADGQHTFSVRAVNSAGRGGPPISLAIWVDTTSPGVTASAPSPGALLNTGAVTVRATVSDAGSGADQTTIRLLINGAPVATEFNRATGVVTSSQAAWVEGANRIELRAADLLGNAATPLIWSVTLDTRPPAGTVTINGGAAMTTSVYVTLGLTAADAVSGVARMMISNDQLTGYVEEPYAPLRPLWRLNPVRGAQTVYVKFVDGAGNISDPVSDTIELMLLSPETLITSGPAGFAPQASATFAFMCPEGGCVFSYAFDGEAWSAWSEAATARTVGLAAGNHYFRVKAAKEANGISGIQPDEEDPTPAERTWIVGAEPTVMAIPRGPAVKFWRVE